MPDRGEGDGRGLPPRPPAPRARDDHPGPRSRRAGGPRTRPRPPAPNYSRPTAVFRSTPAAAIPCSNQQPPSSHSRWIDERGPVSWPELLFACEDVPARDQHLVGNGALGRVGLAMPSLGVADELADVRADLKGRHTDAALGCGRGRLQIWRSESLGRRIVAYANERPDLLWPDQDVMNAVLTDWHELEPTWNVQLGPLRNPALTYFDRQADAGRGPVRRLIDAGAVMHFAGAAKPWNPNASVSCSYRWHRALIRAGWYDPREAVAWLCWWLRRHIIAGTRFYARKLT